MQKDMWGDDISLRVLFARNHSVAKQTSARPPSMSFLEKFQWLYQIWARYCFTISVLNISAIPGLIFCSDCLKSLFCQYTFQTLTEFHCRVNKLEERIYGSFMYCFQFLNHKNYAATKNLADGLTNPFFGEYVPKHYSTIMFRLFPRPAAYSHTFSGHTMVMFKLLWNNGLLESKMITHCGNHTTNKTCIKVSKSWGQSTWILQLWHESCNGTNSSLIYLAIAGGLPTKVPTVPTFSGFSPLTASLYLAK